MDTDPDKLTPAQLDKIADHLIAKALGDNPQAIAEARHLEAGETPTIRGLHACGGAGGAAMSTLVVLEEGQAAPSIAHY